MKKNYFIVKGKKIIILFLLIFATGFLQKAEALHPFLKTELIKSQKRKTGFLKKSTKKTIFNSKSESPKSKKQKISLRTKLSILKLVLKNKTSKKRRYKNKSNKHSKRWNEGHTAGLISWASVLITVMAFFTGHFLTGFLFACVALLALILAFSAKNMSKTTKVVFWFLIGLLLVLFFSVEFPLLTELILYFL